jgi:hypothetical protein
MKPEAFSTFKEQTPGRKGSRGIALESTTFVFYKLVREVTSGKAPSRRQRSPYKIGMCNNYPAAQFVLTAFSLKPTGSRPQMPVARTAKHPAAK